MDTVHGKLTTTNEQPAIASGKKSKISPQRLLRHTGITWFVVTMLGQWAFFYYIFAFYGVAIATGNLEAWNRFEAFKVTPYIVGDTAGNLSFASHAIAAGLIAFVGGLQLIPQIRQKAPTFHRWNGRLYLSIILIATLSGFYLVYFRGNGAKSISDIANTVLGVLIIAISFIALHRVIKGKIESHRRWAMALFLVANAQWFQRIGVMSYMTLGNIFNVKTSFSDAFFPFWKFGCFLIPLAILQLYFIASKKHNAMLAIFTSAIIAISVLLMLVGIAAFGMLSNMIISGKPLVF